MNHPFAIPESEPATVEHFIPDSPIAGEAFVYECPADVVEQIIYCNFGLTTDVNVADRFATIMSERAGIPYQRHLCPTKHEASEIKGYYFMTGVEESTTSSLIDHQTIPMTPHLVLFPGDEFRIEIDNIQAGDQIDVIRITKKVWVTG